MIPSAAKQRFKSITVDSSLGAIVAPAVNLVGEEGITVVGNIRRITFKSVDDSTLVFNGTAPIAIAALGTVSDSAIQSTAPLASLVLLKGWQDTDNGPDSIVAAPWVGTLVSRGEFDAELNLTGEAAPHGTTLNQAVITGSAQLDAWNIIGNASVISIGGNLTSLIAVSGNINVFHVRGNIANTGVLAGTNFGADQHVGGGDDGFVAATIRSFSVLGSISSSIITAGLDPVDGIYSNGKINICPVENSATS